MATRKVVRTYTGKPQVKRDPTYKGYREDKTYADGKIMYRCFGCSWNSMDEKLMRKHVVTHKVTMTEAVSRESN